jgi:protein-tyrosine phosphatase
MKKILFVCTGNTCRSPMAQAWFRYLLEQRAQGDNIEYEVLSAGIHTIDGMSASREAVQIMKEAGLDISSHQSAKLSGELVQDAELILTMTRSHCEYMQNRFPEKAGQIHTLPAFAADAESEVADPYGGGLSEYRNTLAQLQELLAKLLQKLTQQAG